MTPARRRIPKAAIPALLLLALTLEVQAQWVEDSVYVGGAWMGGMVYNSRADVVYGNCQYRDGIFFAIACSSNEVVASWLIPWPMEAAYDSTDNKCYVAFRDGDEYSVMVIDGATHTKLRTIPLEWANIPLWDPVSNRVFVSCLEENRVSVIDCATDTVVKHIQTSPEPLRMHLNNPYRKLYVQCHGSERLNIIDLNTLEVSRNIRLPGLPEAGCYSEAVDKYYCGALLDIVVIDGATDSVVAQIGLSDRVLSMVAVDRHSLVMAGGTHGGSDSVYVIDAGKDSIVRTFSGVSEPYGLYWSEATDLVYCASSRWDQVAVIAGDGSSMLDILQVGDDPFCFAPVPRHRRVYLGHLGSGKVYVIRDSATGVGELAQGPRPGAGVFRAWPNPFEGTVRLVAEWDDDPLAVAVHSADGRLVRMLKREDMVGSRVSLEWNGRDNDGKEVMAGVYIAVAEGQSLRDGVRVVKMR